MAGGRFAERGRFGEPSSYPSILALDTGVKFLANCRKAYDFFNIRQIAWTLSESESPLADTDIFQAKSKFNVEKKII
jgi:hypothetical protein